MIHPARLVEKLAEQQVRCLACIRRCLIRPGKRGWCHTRENRQGQLYSLIYGQVASLSLNPIEKKPVFHFLPGSRWLSLGSLGCNFRCPGCQNWQLAHADLDQELQSTRYLSPADLVELARQHQAVGISWTFNEPTLWVEYILDSAPLARQAGLYTNIVTNGALTQEALDALGPWLDVYRSDIKGFFKQTYDALAQLPHHQEIFAAAERALHHWGMHVELVTNIIPGLNDNEATLEGIAKWIAARLGPDTPWHLTRFYPAYAFQDRPPTPVPTLLRAYEIARAQGLRFVYLGNVPGHDLENTYCPRCGALLIRRSIFDILEYRLKAGRCPDCGTVIPGRWS
ncbi:MAG: AmmeMemoRadiSam system radical SAM enzyme [Deltaproteobacteria bacterium]|nr:AmmeMemoRadiSam system radical SAM enzyme [Deltaproteobacteria bacterium]MBW1986503.1 AmmeMemoRadiSam system radical SAM enzyme [Deltaproteobacteria bacterium]MBW2135081.1 AmmeMemoRadiSam system radical SAM enzyme [Deltaproteobacteria bacterium]